MKRLKNLIIITAVLAVLVGAYFLVSALFKEEEPPETPAAETYTAADIAPDNLAKVEISVREDAAEEGEEDVLRTLSFSLSEGADKWLWSEDENVPLDNAVFASAVSALSGTESNVRLTDVTDEKLEEYGLKTPFISGTFGFSDGTSVTYLVGKRNSFEKKYYFSDAAEPRTVYLVAETVASAMNFTVEDALLWDEIPDITAAKITSLVLEKDGRRCEFTYTPGGETAGSETAEPKDGETETAEVIYWHLSVDGGEAIPVSAEFGNDLSDALGNLYFSDCVQYTGTVSPDYGFDAPAVMTVHYGAVSTVTDAEGGAATEVVTPATYVLKLGAADENGDFYCMTENSQLVYTLLTPEVLTSALSENVAEAVRAAESD